MSNACNADVIGGWVRCPVCAETVDKKLSTSLALGFRNLSFKVSCGNCRFRYKEYDARSDNWRK